MGKIITISRQFGSGGRTVGKMTAEALGIPCYDSEILARLAADSGFAPDYIKEQTEGTQESGLFAALAGRNYFGQSNQDQIWVMQCRLIEELAAKGDCVIVGRCADYVLRDRFDLFRVFIYADDAIRAKRIVEQYGESDVNPQKRLRDKDRKRKAFYEIYTDQKFGDPVNYDACLNSGTLGIDACVDFITGMYREMINV